MSESVVSKLHREIREHHFSGGKPVLLPSGTMLRSTNRSPSPSSLSFDNAAVAADDSPLFRSNSSIKLFLQKIDTRQRLHRLDNTRSAIARFDLAMEFFRRITDGETAANRRTQTINATTTNKTITTTTTTIIIKTTMRKIVEEVKREQRSISVVELPPALAIEKQDQEVEEEEVNGENEVDETVSLIAEQTRSSPPPPPRPWWLSMRNRVKRLYPKSSDDHDAAAESPAAPANSFTTPTTMIDCTLCAWRTKRPSLRPLSNNYVPAANWPGSLSNTRASGSQLL